VRKRNAYPSSGSGGLSQFATGEPVADHTTCTTLGAEGRWFSCGMSSTNYLGGASYSAWWEYDPVANRYTRLTISGLSRGPRSSVAGSAVFDPIDRQIITLNSDAADNIAAQFVNLNTLAVVQSIDYWIASSTISVGDVDTKNHILLIRAGSLYYYLDLNNKASGIKTVTASGSAPASNLALYWHTPSNAFLTWDGGRNLRKLTPAISGRTYTALAWSDVTPASGGATPPASGPAAGMYNKVQMIDDMGDGRSALAIVPVYGNPDVFVYKLPGTVTSVDRGLPRTIRPVNGIRPASAIYDISGRRVVRPGKSGVYLYVTGKRVEKRVFLR
jgi:hypothetical protein